MSIDDAIRLIIRSWEEWEAEASQAAQVEQHEDAFDYTMSEFLRPILEGLK